MFNPPKTRGMPYIPLARIVKDKNSIINKCEVGIKNNRIYIDSREINSLFLRDDKFVIIKAQHFTSKEGTNDIRTHRRFLPAQEDDNYVYFLEDGFYSMSQK